MEIVNCIKNKIFWLCVVAFGVVVLLGSVDTIALGIQAISDGMELENGFHGTLILQALSKDAVTLALPILCALPYTASFIDDVKSGFIKSYLSRTTVPRYIRGKIGACAVSGGLVLALGLLLAYGISAVAFAPMEMALQEGEVAQPLLAELLKRVPLFFCSGAFWALLGMTFAALTKSRYMAFASPFIFYYVLIILNERYFQDFYVLYPKEWLAPGEYWPLGSWGAFLLLAELVLLMAIAFWAAAKRRIEQI